MFCSRSQTLHSNASSLPPQVNEIYHDDSLGAQINVVLVRIIVLGPEKVKYWTVFMYSVSVFTVCVIWQVSIFSKHWTSSLWNNEMSFVACRPAKKRWLKMKATLCRFLPFFYYALFSNSFCCHIATGKHCIFFPPVLQAITITFFCNPRKYIL